jgi:hypothetical protein
MGEQADYEIDRILDGHDIGAPGCWLNKPRRRAPPNCPSCGKVPKRTQTKFGIKRECCGLWGWGEHAPLVDAETHTARQYAHRVFDGLWQKEGVSRSKAYALLAEELGLTRDECHMKLMDKETAQRVPAATHAIWKRLKGNPT